MAIVHNIGYMVAINAYYRLDDGYSIYYRLYGAYQCIP